jgi:S1-C subfamily serine protease
MTKWLQVVVVGLFFALLYLYAGSRMYRVLGSLNHLSSPGWTAQAEGTRVLVRQVNRPASASGLTPGDEVVAINGEHLGGSSHQLEAVLASLKPDESYSIVVLRDGRPLQLVLRAEPLPLSVVVLVQAANVVLPAIFLLTGLGVFLL